MVRVATAGSTNTAYDDVVQYGRVLDGANPHRSPVTEVNADFAHGRCRVRQQPLLERRIDPRPRDHAKAVRRTRAAQKGTNRGIDLIFGQDSTAFERTDELLDTIGDCGARIMVVLVGMRHVRFSK